MGYHMGAGLNFAVFKFMGTVLGHNAESELDARDNIAQDRKPLRPKC